MRGYRTDKTKGGVTVHSDKTKKNYHVANQADAKRLEKLHDEFKHMRESAAIFKRR